MNECDVFVAALEFDSPEERSAWLDETCGDDPHLRQRVETLLDSHSAAGSLLDHPAVDVVTHVVSDSGTQPSVDDIPLDFLELSEQTDSLGRLGQYEILEAIGRGGMGIVLKAQDTSLNRIVAVKVLAPELASNATARMRFLREGQAAAAVSHDHVVTIHAVEKNEGVSTELPYLVMEYIDGLSLQQKIDQQGPLELKEILRIGRQVALGLSAAHEQGLIHRDVKPSNILLQNGVQRVQITDFGLARAVDDVGMTKTGEIAGTPQYMSPEQAQGHPVDARSDLFSLGSVLYAMCTGRSPFPADTSVATLRRVCDDTPRPIREVNPDVPEWLIAVIDKLLAKDPDERFQSAEEVARLLEQYLAHLQEPSAVPEPPRPSIARPGGRRALKLFQLPAVVAVLLIAGLAAQKFVEITGEPAAEDEGDGVLQHELLWKQPLLSEVMSISPDGRHVAFFDINSSDLWVHDLNADEDRRLTTASGPDGGFYTSEAVFSPDGQWLACNWLDEDDACALHVVRADGTESRQVLPPEEGRWIQPRGWTPDGREILCILQRADHTQIAFVNVEDGAVREVKSLDAFLDPYPIVALSPDGRYIACEIPDGDEDAQSEASRVYVLSADGSREESMPGADDVRILGWTPDGERLMVWMKRFAEGAFLVRLKDGRPAGHPMLVQEGLERNSSTPGQFTGDGAFYYVRSGTGGDDELWVLRNFLPVPQPEPDNVVWSAPQHVISVAADESLLAFRDGDTGDLAIRLLPDGPVRRLSENAVAWENYPDRLLVSPDGRFVACTWWSEGGLETDLRLFPTDGGEPRVLYTPDGDEVRLAVPQDWSPDGQQLLVRFAVGAVAEHMTQIALIPLDGGPPRILESLPYRHGFNSGSNVRFSPDARFIAYETWSDEHYRDTDIALMSLDGQHESVLVEHRADDDLIDWLPDGRGLLFHRWKRNNEREIWLIRIEDGEPEGEPRRVFSSIGDYGEFAADGTFYDVGMGALTTDVWIATLDLESGEVLEAPVKASERFPGQTRMGAWSPHGESLAYYAKSSDLSHNPIVIRSSETGEEREIMLPDLHGFLSGMLAWSPDGTWLLVENHLDQDRSGIYRLNVETSAETGDALPVVPQTEDFQLWQHGWSEDGSEVVLRRASNPDRVSRFEQTVTQEYLRLNLESGTTTLIYEQVLDRNQANPLVIDAQVSPDGTRLAVLQQTDGELSLFTAPIAGGEPQVIYETSSAQYSPGKVSICLAWTHDSKALIFSQQTRRSVGTDPRRNPLAELWRIPAHPAEGREPEPLGFAACGLFSLDTHPDGQRIAYTRRQQMYDLRAREDLLEDEP